MEDRGYTARVDRLFEKVPDEVDVVLLSPSKSLQYFTGLAMHQSERPTLIALFRDHSPAAVLPELEVPRVKEVVSDIEPYSYGDAPDPAKAARGAFEQLATERNLTDPIGVEFRSTRLLEKQVFAPDETQYLDIEPGIVAVRSRKDSEEIDRMRTAVTITGDILEEVFERIEPGQTEAEIESKIKRRVLESDADEYGVGVVTSGPRTANAHTNTGTRSVEGGDLVMIDTGVVYDGYYSDITRTVAVGEPSEELRDIYEVVREAAKEARETVAPGVACQEIDRAAREVVEEAGYGEYFPHRVGHGLGLEGHEPPYLVEGNEQPLDIGHAITVEPGIYIEGVGGVRIEDNVVVTEDGADILSTSPRSLREL